MWVFKRKVMARANVETAYPRARVDNFVLTPFIDAYITGILVPHLSLSNQVQRRFPIFPNHQTRSRVIIQSYIVYMTQTAPRPSVSSLGQATSRPLLETRRGRQTQPTDHWAQQACSCCCPYYWCWVCRCHRPR